MIEYPYYFALALFFAWAIVDWRRGIYGCLLFDVIRDPVRKLSETQSVAVTVAGAALWFAVFLGAAFSLGPQLFVITRRLPSLHNAMGLLLLALIPGACVSLVTLPGGWRLVIVGFASYTVPIMGILVGYHFLNRTESMWRMMAFYCAVNAVALTGSLFEFLKFKHPALGGINMTWLRYEPGYTVELISGLYRSPDVMGLHAANATMFATLLTLRQQSRFRAIWIGLLLWSSFCLLISGRRKMIGMLLVFAATYVGLRFRRSGINRGLSVLFPLVLLSVVAGASFYMFASERGLDDYTRYAGTTVTVGAERFRSNVIEGVIETVGEAGLLGNGLGTGTQGAYYTEGLGAVRNWQEDGVSRIFAEMGLLGAVLVAVAAIKVGRASIQALKQVSPNDPIQELQIGLAAVIAASAASFVISHQAFSGDPCAILFVSFLLGVFWSGPAQVMRKQLAVGRIAPPYSQTALRHLVRA
jgi:hypothetical protein